MTLQEQINKLSEQIARINKFLQDEVVSERIQRNANVDTLSAIGKIATMGLIREDSITKEEMLQLISIYPNYEVGKAYKIGDIFAYNEQMFETIQAHTSQADWLPISTLALYKNKTPSVVIPNWVQPIGSTDAYKIGDKVIFEGKTYESLISANVWSPTGYPAGWKLIQ